MFRLKLMWIILIGSYTTNGKDRWYLTIGNKQVSIIIGDYYQLPTDAYKK